MELLIARCAGLDVHQATVVATVRTPDDRGGRRRVTETFGTMTPDLLALREWLQAYGVTHVALESTGVYWKPVYYIGPRRKVYLDAGFTNLAESTVGLSSTCSTYVVMLSAGLTPTTRTMYGTFTPPTSR